MRNPDRALTLAVACLLAALPLAAAPALADTPSFPTNALSQTGMSVATIGPSQGVLLNFTSTTSVSTGFMYLDLTNAAGQTVYWYPSGCGFSAGQTNQCFVAIPASLPHGSYTATAFITTTTGIAISTAATLKLTL